MLQLRPPHSGDFAEFSTALAEIHHTQNGLRESLRLPPPRNEAEFAALLAQLRRFEPPRPVSPPHVPAYEYWLFDGQSYIGRIKIRLRLTPALRRMGGHIGYEIRPSRQGQGYGRQLLALGLQRAHALGLLRVLISCDAANIASQRLIEANGGVCEGLFRLPEYPPPILRYWLAARP